jgi:hypothetical protein
MTVYTTNAYSGPFTADGIVRAFPFTFTVLSANDVQVLVNGGEVTSGFAISLSSTAAGGSVVFDLAPAAGAVILIALDPSFTQTADFQDGAAWRAASVNAANDRAVLRDQVLQRDVARSLLVPLGEAGGALPGAAVRANGFLAFDNAGLPIVSLGTGADVGLRGDLAAASGTGLLGFTPLATGGVRRSLQDKVDDLINVRDFGAALDGVTDDYPAFLRAYNACASGGTVFVPYTAGGAYLSANPDAGTKPIIWSLDIGVKLSGPGIGSPSTGAGTFGSLRTNPWLRVNGKSVYSDLTTLPSPVGGAVVGDSWEFRALDAAKSYKAITGTITNGSAVMTAVSDTSGIYPGDAIMAVSSITGWPLATGRSDAMRVVSVSGNTITFGPDAGAGQATPTPWTGATTVGASFKIRRRQLMAGWYSGLSTGTVDNIDVHHELWNPVLNITGSAGAAIEIDLNCYANTSDFSRALFITGGGSGTTIGGVPTGNIIAIDIQRGGQIDWGTGISLRRTRVGLYTNAKFPIKIDTSYLNGVTGSTETIGYGIHFENITGLKGALFEGAQLANNADAIWLQRATDTAPTGNFLNLYAADGTTRLGFWSVSGELHATGLHVLAGGVLNMETTFTPGAVSATGYTTIKVQGVTYKLLLAA